jgi:hypothetical protein
MKQITRRSYNDTNRTKVTHRHKSHESSTNRTKATQRQVTQKWYVKIEHHINLIDGNASVDGLRAAHRANSSEAMVTSETVQRHQKTIGSDTEGRVG